MTNTIITIGSTQYTTTNDLVLQRLNEFINGCIAKGAVQVVDTFGAISTDGITATATEAPTVKQERKVAPATDVTVNLKFTAVKSGSDTYYVVEPEQYLGTAGYKVLFQKLSEYPMIRVSRQLTAGKRNKRHLPEGTVYTTDAPAVTAAVMKKMPKSVALKASEIEAARAEIAKRYSK